jgi:ABC-type branched-subunit amino acid transport system substrate-binding protein
MKRIVALAALALAAIAPASAAAGSSQVVIQRGEPVEIAFANDLSGFASSFGQSFANAVQMAVESHPAIRGFPIRVNVVDAPCGDPGADVAAATAIVSNPQNVAVLGQLCTFGFDQSLPLYEATGVVTVTGSATGDGLPSFGPTVFNRTAVSDGDGFGAWYDIVSLLPSDIAWRQAYALRFGATPAALADLYYDAASLLIRSLQQVSTMDGGSNLVIDRAALAHAVRSTTKFAGVTCRITVDPATGNRVNDPASLSECAAGG